MPKKISSAQLLARIDAKLNTLIRQAHDEGLVQRLTFELRGSADALAAAITTAGGSPTVSLTRSLKEFAHMANPTLAALADQVTKTTEVEASAVQVLNGIAARIQTAVDAAIANGATADELAPVQTEVDALKASSDSLAAAVAANT